MRRILKAIAIVVSLSILGGVIAWIVVDVLGWEVPEWLFTIMSYLFGWPLLILKPFIPASDSTASHAPLLRNLLFMVAVILDLVLYVGLACAVLYWREKRTTLRTL